MSGAHSHGHPHDHHGHHHGQVSHGRAFAFGIALNSLFVAIEAGYGIVSGSMALVADAGHNLGDVLGLVIAWGAAILSSRAPSGRYTYGFKSSSILAAILNACLLLVAVGAIAVETIRRLIDPQPVAGGTVMIVAAIGIVVNGLTALLFLRGRHDINIRGAFLHMVADAAVSAGVVLAGLAILMTGRNWIDPAISLIVIAVIAAGSWGLLRDSVRMGLLGVPMGIEQDAVRAFLLNQPGVAGLHDLHIWPLSTTETAMTVHLLMPQGHPGDSALAELVDTLAHRFAIGHTTIQIETSGGYACALEPDHVV